MGAGDDFERKNRGQELVSLLKKMSLVLFSYYGFQCMAKFFELILIEETKKNLDQM